MVTPSFILPVHDKKRIGMVIDIPPCNECPIEAGYFCADCAIYICHVHLNKHQGGKNAELYQAD